MHASHPMHLCKAALVELAHLMPPTAQALVAALGEALALRLLLALPGVQFVVPKDSQGTPATQRRWLQLVDAVGEDGAALVAQHLGGELLDVPACTLARRECRNRWLRKRFDELTTGTGELTKAGAVYELGLELAAQGQPMTYRQIEACVDQSDVTPENLHSRSATEKAWRREGQLPMFPLLDE